MADRCHRAEQRRLRRALDTMPAEARAVFDRHRYEEMDYAGIALELGIPISEVERRMASAMLHLLGEAAAPDADAFAPIGTWLRATLARVWQR